MIWRDIPGYPGYQASDDGCIRSVDRTIVDSIGRRRRLSGRILATSTDDKGYLRVGFGLVHRLICLAHIGIPESPELHAAHRDGNNRNNHPDNLYWATVTENNRDIVRHGRHHHARKTHCVRNHKLLEGARRCAECHRERCRVYRENNREMVRSSGLASYHRQKATA